MNYQFKRNLLRFLEITGLKRPLRALYRMIVGWRIKQQHGSIDTHEVEIDGVKVIFSVADLYSKRYFLLDDDHLWEETVTKVITEQLPQMRCFVDVGANLGYYTCLASKLMPNGTVYAFELDDMNLALLRRNLELNHCQNVEVLHAAISDTTGTMQYVRDTDSPSLGFGLSTNPETDRKYGELVTVPSYSLDDFFNGKSITPAIVKMDIEGAEYHALLGMKRLLQSGDVSVFVEIHPQKIPTFGATTEQLVNFLLDCECTVYELSKVSDGQHELKPLSRNTKITENHVLYAHKA